MQKSIENTSSTTLEIKKQEDKSIENSSIYLESIANAYVFYKDWGIAKDIAGIKNSAI